MHSVTYVLSPEKGWAGEDSTGRDSPVVGTAVHDIRLLNDGTVLGQYEVDAAAESVRECFEGHCERILDHQVAGITEETSLLQLHFEPSGLLAELLELHRASPVSVEFPIDVVDADAGSLRLVVLGRVEHLQRLVEEVRQVATVTIEEVGEHNPTPNRLYAKLTDRQQQVLCTALERGYYDVPRDVTYEDIARDLNCSASTVGQHLRRIEAAVLSEIAPTGPKPRQPERPVL